MAGPDGELYVPAFRVDAVDTTGAGDVFHGAYLYGHLQGWPAVPRLRFAAAAAALKCRHLGGRAGIPTRAEVEQFLVAHGAEPPQMVWRPTMAANKHQQQVPDAEGDGRDAEGSDEYRTMLTLERLETLREEMEELGVRSLAEVNQRIEELHRLLDAR
jgi:hypothetical protein